MVLVRVVIRRQVRDTALRSLGGPKALLVAANSGRSLHVGALHTQVRRRRARGRA